MSSVGSKIVNAGIKLFTYKYRKEHLSISKNIKIKTVNYKPKQYNYEVLLVNNCKVEKLSYKKFNKDINIIQFHGGGGYQGMNKVYRKVAEKLAKNTGATVYSIDYVPYENYVYPSLHNICYDVCLELEQIINFDKTIMIGDSIGANFLLSTCHKLQQNSYKLPNKIICISPFVDLSASGDSYKFNCYNDPSYSLPKNQSYEEYGDSIRRKSSYIGKSNPKEPYLSPVFLEYQKFPPTLIQVGSFETDLSDSLMLKSAFDKNNNDVTLTVYDGLFHDFQYFAPFLKDSKLAWKEIYKFINY